MKEINKFRIWARRSGLWTLDQIHSLEDDSWESDSPTLTVAANAWIEANNPEHNGDYTDFLMAFYIDDIEDDEADFIELDNGDIEYADPAFYAGYLAWKASYNG